MGSTDTTTLENEDSPQQNGKITQNGNVENFKNVELKEANGGNTIIDNSNDEVEDEIKIDFSWPSGTGPDKIRPTDDIYTSAPDGCVKIRNSFDIDTKPISVPTLLDQAVEKWGDLPALGSRNGNGWDIVNFRQYRDNVRTVAKAFLKLGLERYHSVCILGMNSKEWFYSDIAAIYAGGYAAGIYTTNSSDACLHCLKTSYANIVVVENDMQLQKILKIRDQAPDVKAIIQYDGKPSDSSVLSWQDLMDIGSKESDEKLNEVVNTLAVNECCSLLYTSGTTSLPKAVMLSHDNLIYNSTMAAKYLEMQPGNERILSYLPLSHAAAQAADLFMGLVCGACVYFGDKNVLKGSMVDNLKSMKPTILFGVPRVWEKIKEGLETAEKKSSKLKQFLFYHARSAGLSHYKAVSEGYIGESLSYKFYKRIVFNKVKEALGFEQCRTFLSGAAPIPVEVREYLMSLDMPVTEVYGMSETSGGHFISKSPDLDLQAIGRTFPGTRSKIDKPDEDGNGEICMYGRNVFMGYLNDPEKTKEALDPDGWLHSGDLGKINKNSFLQITGRIKELIITAGGENVAPALIELALKTEIPIISQAVVVGDRRKYLTLLATLKCVINMDTGVPQDELSPEAKLWLKSVGANQYKTVSEIIENKPEDVYKAIEAGIKRVNDNAISLAQRIQKFTILSKDFSLATGELGPTMKVMKRVVFVKYEKEIEAMYA